MGRGFGAETAAGKTWSGTSRGQPTSTTASAWTVGFYWVVSIGMAPAWAHREWVHAELELPLVQPEVHESREPVAQENGAIFVTHAVCKTGRA